MISATDRSSFSSQAGRFYAGSGEMQHQLIKSQVVDQLNVFVEIDTP